LAKNCKQIPPLVGDLSPQRIARDKAIEAQYAGNPSLRAQFERGDFDRETYERMAAEKAAGPSYRPFGDLIAALRAERERQGLSLADVTARSGMDRAAVHKLEIGLNKNPTAETLDRYAGAMGKTIRCAMEDRIESPPAKSRGRAGTPSRQTGGRKTKMADAVKAHPSQTAAHVGHSKSLKKKQPT
jgi:transcriptional regulator with XRE-family HTH domain